MVKIAVVIPIHGRTELARRVVLYYETLCIKGVDITIVPVVDTGDEASEFMANAIAGENLALGAKFNFGIWSCGLLEEGIRGVMIVGSDDLIHPEMFERIRDEKPLYLEIGGCHFFESQTGCMLYIEKFNCGAGKYFSHEFLDRCDWKPYDDELNKNVDTSPRGYLKSGERQLFLTTKTKPLCIDIKTANENMWDFAWVEAQGGVELTAPETAHCFKEMNNERPEWWMGL